MAARATWYGGPQGPGPDGMSIYTGSCNYGEIENHFISAWQGHSLGLLAFLVILPSKLLEPTGKLLFILLCGEAHQRGKLRGSIDVCPIS